MTSRTFSGLRRYGFGGAPLASSAVPGTAATWEETPDLCATAQTSGRVFNLEHADYHIPLPTPVQICRVLKRERMRSSIRRHRQDVDSEAGPLAAVGPAILEGDP